MRFALSRVGYAALVMFLASLVTFFALRIAPGSVTSSLLNPTTTTPELVAALETRKIVFKAPAKSPEA